MGALSPDAIHIPVWLPFRTDTSSIQPIRTAIRLLAGRPSGDIRSAYTVCWSVKFNRRRRIRRRLLNENADADEAREGEKKREKQDRRKEGTRRVRTNLTATRLLDTKDEEIYLNGESKNALPPTESRTRRPRGEGQ